MAALSPPAGMRPRPPVARRLWRPATADAMRRAAAAAIPDSTRAAACRRIRRGYAAWCRHSSLASVVAVCVLVLAKLVALALDGRLAVALAMAAAAASALPPSAAAAVAAVAASALTAALTLTTRRARSVRVLDFVVFRPADHLACSPAVFEAAVGAIETYTPESRGFMKKILVHSGVGPAASMPAIMHTPPPWKITLAACREEAEMVMFDIVEKALVKTGLKPSQIDALIVNCSIFCPTPSLSSMVVRRFGLRADCVTYNLGGMGCSASPIAVDLGATFLATRPRGRVLVVSTENITHNLYTGNARSMLIPGCIFRLGGAAILLSNHPADARRSKYDLHHVVRTHAGGDDAAYGCVYQCEDEDGVVGVRLSKDLMKVAGATLRANITRLGPRVLPTTEQVAFAVNFVARKFLNLPVKPYIPDFKLAFDHFCLHTGGRAVIDEVEAQLGLTPALARPSKEALRRYGNTSSASIWYVLAWIEALEGVARGDRVWQIAFGSGFKVNSAVLRARRAVVDAHPAYADWAPAEGDAWPVRRVRASKVSA